MVYHLEDVGKIVLGMDSVVGIELKEKNYCLLGSGFIESFIRFVYKVDS